MFQENKHKNAFWYELAPCFQQKCWLEICAKMRLDCHR